MSEDTKTEATPTAGPMIHAAMARCMAEIGAVGKNRENKEQKYAFRALADVYKSCQPVLARNGVHFAPYAIQDYVCHKYERETPYGTKYTFHVTMKVEHRFYASDGSYIPVVTIGEATDFSDKASNKAMSASAKYALVQAFCLPEEDPDADADHSSPEIEVAKPKVAEAPKPAPPTEDDKAKAAKVRALVIAIKKAGVADEDRLAWMSSELAKPVNSSKDLSVAELDTLLASAKNLGGKK